jgi:hypothetical protein
MEQFAFFAGEPFSDGPGDLIFHGSKARLVKFQVLSHPLPKPILASTQFAFR